MHIIRNIDDVKLLEITRSIYHHRRRFSPENFCCPLHIKTKSLFGKDLRTAVSRANFQQKIRVLLQKRLFVFIFISFYQPSS
jgi:hypothetical protein